MLQVILDNFIFNLPITFVEKCCVSVLSFASSLIGEGRRFDMSRVGRLFRLLIQNVKQNRSR